MIRLVKNIARYITVGFLLLALSGMTVVIHHDHSIEKSPDQIAVHHGTQTAPSIRSAPSTYHEIHFIKLVSGDSFNPSQKIDFKASFKSFGPIALDHVEFSPAYHSSSLVNIDTKESGPPSVDKCVLFCSFLV